MSKIPIKKRKTSLLIQITAFYIISTMVIAVLSYATLKNVSNASVRDEKVRTAGGILVETEAFLKEYNSWEWLITYWREHKYELDLEYDGRSVTDKKERMLEIKYDGVNFQDMSSSDVYRLFPEEDKKIFAEVAYNRIINNLNKQIQSYPIDYIYVLSADKDCNECEFLMSGSDGTKKRGLEFGDAFEIGYVMDITELQRQTLIDTMECEYKLVDSKETGYTDRYEYITTINDRNIFIGLSFNLVDVEEEIEVETIVGTTYFVLLQIFLAISCLLILIAFVINPLHKISNSIQNYENNKDSEQVTAAMSKVTQRNEIGILAEEFSNMTVTLDEYINEVREITAEKEKIGAELSVATRIQEDMLPRIFPPFPDRKDFDIYAIMDPAKEVGGDFYDFFLIDDDHFAMVIADVSGKSVPAALFMVIAKVLIKSRAMSGGSLKDILKDVNNQLCENNDLGFFVTVWMAIVELSTGKGVSANAGHEHPIVKRKGGVYEPIIYKHSMPLGIMSDMEYREREFVMLPGDTVFVYTDGVPEATNKKEELYGIERVVAVLNATGDLSNKEVLDAVRKDMDDFVQDAEQFDDITMMAFTYNKKLV